MDLGDTPAQVYELPVHFALKYLSGPLKDHELNRKKKSNDFNKPSEKSVDR
jgi:hypothetical protein